MLWLIVVWWLLCAADMRYVAVDGVISTGHLCPYQCPWNLTVAFMGSKMLRCVYNKIVYTVIATLVRLTKIYAACVTTSKTQENLAYFWSEMTCFDKVCESRNYRKFGVDSKINLGLVSKCFSFCPERPYLGRFKYFCCLQRQPSQVTRLVPQVKAPQGVQW